MPIQGPGRLPHCWVCERRFVTSSPPGPALEEVHHIVPQAYGGTDGPVVSLCGDHHSALHKIALAFKSLKSKKPKPYHMFLVGLRDDQKKKLLWLAQCAYNAEQEVSKDPNKHMAVVLSLDGRQRIMMDRLRAVYPQAKSKDKLLALALESLYFKHFTTT